MAAKNTVDPFAEPDFSDAERIITSRKRVILDVGDEFRGLIQGFENVPLNEEGTDTGLYVNFLASFPDEVKGEEVAMSASYNIEKALKGHEGQWAKIVCTRTAPSKKGNDVKIYDIWVK